MPIFSLLKELNIGVSMAQKGVKLKFCFYWLYCALGRAWVYLVSLVENCRQNVLLLSYLLINRMLKTAYSCGRLSQNLFRFTAVYCLGILLGVITGLIILFCLLVVDVPFTILVMEETPAPTTAFTGP